MRASLSRVPWLYIAFLHPTALSQNLPAIIQAQALVVQVASGWCPRAPAISSWLRLEGHDKLLLAHHWARTDQERHQRLKTKVSWRSIGRSWSKSLPLSFGKVKHMKYSSGMIISTWKCCQVGQKRSDVQTKETCDF